MISSARITCCEDAICFRRVTAYSYSVENHLLPIGNRSLSGSRVRRSDLDVVTELAKLFGYVLCN